MTKDNIEFKRGEGKTITFTIKDEDSVVVDVSTATFKFCVKLDIDSSTYVIEKNNADFDVSEAVSGEVSVTITATETDIAPEIYVSELAVIWSDDAVDKSNDLAFVIKKSVIS